GGAHTVRSALVARGIEHALGFVRVEVELLPPQVLGDELLESGPREDRRVRDVDVAEHRDVRQLLSIDREAQAAAQLEVLPQLLLEVEGEVEDPVPGIPVAAVLGIMLDEDLVDVRDEVAGPVDVSGLHRGGHGLAGVRGPGQVPGLELLGHPMLVVPHEGVQLIGEAIQPVGPGAHRLLDLLAEGSSKVEKMCSGTIGRPTIVGSWAKFVEPKLISAVSGSTTAASITSRASMFVAGTSRRIS